jgi:hypothetical protein
MIPISCLALSLILAAICVYTKSFKSNAVYVLYIGYLATASLYPYSLHFLLNEYGSEDMGTLATGLQNSLNFDTTNKYLLLSLLLSLGISLGFLFASSIALPNLLLGRSSQASITNYKHSKSSALANQRRLVVVAEFLYVALGLLYLATCLAAYFLYDSKLDFINSGQALARLNFHLGGLTIVSFLGCTLTGSLSKKFFSPLTLFFALCSAYLVGQRDFLYLLIMLSSVTVAIRLSLRKRNNPCLATTPSPFFVSSKSLNIFPKTYILIIGFLLPFFLNLGALLTSILRSGFVFENFIGLAGFNALVGEAFISFFNFSLSEHLGYSLSDFTQESFQNVRYQAGIGGISHTGGSIFFYGKLGLYSIVLFGMVTGFCFLISSKFVLFPLAYRYSSSPQHSLCLKKSYVKYLLASTALYSISFPYYLRTQLDGVLSNTLTVLILYPILLCSFESILSALSVSKSIDLYNH